MKKIIALALCVMMITSVFGGCSAEEKANFSGNADEYVYMYENGRNRDWEEDIIYLAKTFLEMHPTLVDGNSFVYNVSPGNLVVESMNLYNENIYKEFIDGVNILIPKIDELGDMEIIGEICKLRNILNDPHSYIGIESFIDSFFPVASARGIYVDGKKELYVRVVEEEYADLLYAKIETINGVSASDIFEKLNEEYGTFTSESVVSKKILDMIGVSDENDETVHFVFTKTDGTTAEYDFGEKSYSELDWNKLCWEQLEILNSENRDRNYWYKIISEDTVYINVSAFMEDSYKSIGRMAQEIYSETENLDIEKIILDIRGNSYGSSQISGYSDFLEMLCDENMGNVYIIMDEITKYNAVMAASHIKQDNPNAVIVGSSDESPNFLMPNGPEQTLPNTGLTYHYSDRMMISWPGYEYDVLMPDIEIYQTVEDYKNGVDTVLEAVIAME